MISESLPGTLEVPRKSQIRESFGPVQRNAMPTAPVRAPAIISKVGHSRGLTPTAADPKQKLPSESVRGCSEKVLKASGEPFRVEGVKIWGGEFYT